MDSIDFNNNTKIVGSKIFQNKEKDIDELECAYKYFNNKNLTDRSYKINKIKKIQVALNLMIIMDPFHSKNETFLYVKDMFVKSI